jgi:hypothetical protein
LGPADQLIRARERIVSGKTKDQDQPAELSATLAWKASHLQASLNI